eukprot:761719-Hanusia_phi.AAC.2
MSSFFWRLTMYKTRSGGHATAFCHLPALARRTLQADSGRIGRQRGDVPIASPRGLWGLESRKKSEDKGVPASKPARSCRPHLLPGRAAGNDGTGGQAGRQSGVEVARGEQEGTDVFR